MLSLPQNIAELHRHSLRPSSGIFWHMPKQPDEPVGETLARNLRALMAEHELYRSAAAIARAMTDVTDNTVLNMLRPEREVSPTIRTVAALAALFEREAWELLHPDLPAVDRERAVLDAWRRIEQNVNEHPSPVRLRPSANPPRPPTVHEPRQTKYLVDRKRSGRKP